MALRRIAKEIKEFEANPLKGVSIKPTEDDSFVWTLSIEGPAGSPYEGGTFFATLNFPSAFPFKPPKMAFTTKIFHPNIAANGNVCCCFSLLSEEWSPSLTIRKVMEAFFAFLVDTDADCNRNPDAYELQKSEPDKFIATVKEWTKKYAM